jgi:DUF4097 and DUF4098 domain-containing protein YvlB
MSFRLRTFPALLVLAALPALAAAPAWASDEGHFDRTLSVTGAVDLDVQTGSGNITVRAGDSSKVEIHAKIHASDWHAGSDVEARIKSIEDNPPIEQSGNTIRIGHETDREREHNISISYEVIVPAQTKLHSQSGSGDESAKGISGPVDSNSGSGSLRLSEIGGEVRAHTGSGDIDVNSIQGASHFHTGSGSIHAIGIGGSFDGETGSGDIRLEQSTPGDVEISTGSGSVEVKGVKGGVRVNTGSGEIEASGDPTGEWKLRTGSGNVTVDFPKQAAFELVAHTSSGSISTDSDHSITLQGTINPRELHGKVNGGGSLVDLSTSSGNIRIR